MELAAVAGFVCERALEELDACSHNEWRGPVFCCKPRATQTILLCVASGILLAFAWGHGAVVLQHVIRAELRFEEFAIHPRGLFDDARVGNHDDDAAQTARVVRGKRRVVVSNVP